RGRHGAVPALARVPRGSPELHLLHLLVQYEQAFQGPQFAVPGPEVLRAQGALVLHRELFHALPFPVRRCGHYPHEDAEARLHPLLGQRRRGAGEHGRGRRRERLEAGQRRRFPTPRSPRDLHHALRHRLPPGLHRLHCPARRHHGLVLRAARRNGHVLRHLLPLHHHG
ncbi:unnamed protein product, partial [Prorocentrum cordatum]